MATHLKISPLQTFSTWSWMHVHMHRDSPKAVCIRQLIAGESTTKKLWLLLGNKCSLLSNKCLLLSNKCLSLGNTDQSYLKHGETSPLGFMFQVGEGVVVETATRNINNPCQCKFVTGADEQPQVSQNHLLHKPLQSENIHSHCSENYHTTESKCKQLSKSHRHRTVLTN